MYRMLVNLLSVRFRKKLKDFLEFFYRKFPPVMRGISKYRLVETQVYPFGDNFYPHIRRSVLKNFQNVSINQVTPVASIGTCFAEEFSIYMKERGENYLYKEENVFHASANWGRVYTIPNFLQIVKYSLTEDFPIFVSSCSKGFFDPLREYSVGYYSSYDAAVSAIKAHRLMSQEVFRQAELLVITLGQNEAWVDTETQIVYGSIPSLDVMEASPSRFRSVEFSYDENLKNLTEAIELIIANNKKIKIIITVSPVAAFATFLACDVVTQSFAGKSLLRAVVHEAIKKHNSLFYFPSFEMVFCENASKFRADNRHVKHGTVNQIFSLLGDVLK